MGWRSRDEAFRSLGEPTLPTLRGPWIRPPGPWGREGGGSGGGGRSGGGIRIRIDFKLSKFDTYKEFVLVFGAQQEHSIYNNRHSQET